MRLPGRGKEEVQPKHKYDEPGEDEEVHAVEGTCLARRRCVVFVRHKGSPGACGLTGCLFDAKPACVHGL